MSTGKDPIARTKKMVALARECSVSITQAIAVVLVRIGGTVVDAKLKGNPGEVHWRIKLLTAEGPVKVYVDGRTGEILEAWASGSLPAPGERVSPKELVAGHTEELESTPR